MTPEEAVKAIKDGTRVEVVYGDETRYRHARLLQFGVGDGTGVRGCLTVDVGGGVHVYVGLESVRLQATDRK